MPDERLSLLWLCGPPGVGKSAVGWTLYAALARSGARAGFIDIDQLGMCLPALPGDPEPYGLKERNLSALSGNFRAADCDAIVLSGDLGPSPGISTETVPGSSLTICRLRASLDELGRRLVSRREGPKFVAGALCQDEELDRTSFADACVDTDGLTVAEVARLVKERCGEWPTEQVASTRKGISPAPVTNAVDDVLLVCGATGVGKPTAGFDVFLRQRRAGLAAAYIDLGQLGFITPAPNDDPGGHQFRARNLADHWRNYQAAGARRIALRGQGLSWPQPGHPLISQPEVFGSVRNCWANMQLISSGHGYGHRTPGLATGVLLV